jgi:hypothetical protein
MPRNDPALLTAQHVIWECDSSDDNSVLIDLPPDEPVTFVDYQVISAMPADAGPSCQRTESSVSPAAFTIPSLPVAVAFRTGITIQQWTDMELEPADDTRKTQRQLKRTPWCIFITALGLLVAISTALLVCWLTGNLSASASEADEAITFSLSSPTETTIFNSIYNCTNVKALVNVTDSPQRKAWALLLSNIRSESTASLIIDPVRIRQRFAIAALFYSFSIQPQAHLHECAWTWNKSQSGVLHCTLDKDITIIHLSKTRSYPFLLHDSCMYYSSQSLYSPLSLYEPPII